MTYRPNRPLRNSFAYFRRAWSPRASYHLARMRYGTDWRDRLASVAWLAARHIPATGAAPSIPFAGSPI
jgi:hypothetical protein